MNPFSYLNELIAVIVGILIVLLPLVFRLFLSAMQNAKVRRERSGGSGTKSPRDQITPPGPFTEDTVEYQVMPRRNKIDNYIRRIKQTGPVSEDSATGESWPPKAAGRERMVKPAEEEGIVAMPALIATKYMESQEPAADSEGWRRINKLPVLKRAIILQALLGRPKGIKEIRFDD